MCPILLLQTFGLLNCTLRSGELLLSYRLVTAPSYLDRLIRCFAPPGGFFQPFVDNTLSGTIQGTWPLAGTEIGPSDDVTIPITHDYNLGYCRQSLSSID